MYTDIYNKYYGLLMGYLDYYLNLKEIDDNIAKSIANFKCVDESKMDKYQLMCHNNYNYKYIYLRNDLYVDRLTNDELQVLSGLDSINENSIDFIKKTFPKVINYFYPETVITNYGPAVEKYMTSSNNIVFGFRYDSVYSEEDKAFDAFAKRKLDEMFYQEYMRYKGEKNGLDISLLVYNNYSVADSD